MDSFIGVYVGLGVAIVTNFIVVAYGYGKINETVSNLCKGFEKHLNDCKMDMSAMHNKCNSLSDKVSTIEGELKK